MASRQVLCEVAGKVLRIEAGPGTRVAEGDAILLIECMKMEIPLVAPRAGRIAALHVGEGDAVAEGQAAATLEVG
jgi:biotin carboxyl carrier protein